jgi:hypothetical protein
MSSRLLASDAWWWLFYVLVVAAFYLVFEVGFRYGRRRRPHTDAEKKALTATLVTALLALMSFLLANSFSIAASRFGDRKALVLDEANTVGTAWLRADFLPAPQRANVRRLLADYLEMRIVAVEQDEDLPDAIARAGAMHGALWAEAVTAAQAEPRSLPVALFVQALNDVIELHRSRVTVALRYRVPPLMLRTLFLIALMAVGTMGVHFGLGGTRNLPVMLGLLIAFGSILLILVELDRPARRVFRVDMRPLVETLDWMRRGAPSP